MPTTLFAPDGAWNGKIYSNGWQEPGLGTEPVIEKATGAVLGHTGIASAADVASAAAAARQAQTSWARVPAPQRGDVLRRFAELLVEHADEIAEQLMRETGAIRFKGEWEAR